MCLYPLFVHGSLCACGKCMECLIAKSNEWAFRCCLEASLYKDNCCITLTYNNDFLPSNETLVKSDLQKFVKRLRKHLEPVKIRYFACGEYGSLRGRPHYHIIVFNYKPPDLVYFFTDKKGTDVFLSREIQKLWKFGFSSVVDVSLNTAKYCAKYLQKIPTDSRLKPFTVMSKGLGFLAVDFICLDSDKIYFNGKYIKIPRYYLDRFSREGFSDKVEFLKAKRRVNAFCEFSEHLDLQEVDHKTGEVFDVRYNYIDYDVYKIAVDERRKKFEKIFGKDFFKYR